MSIHMSACKYGDVNWIELGACPHTCLYTCIYTCLYACLHNVYKQVRRCLSGRATRLSTHKRSHTCLGVTMPAGSSYVRAYMPTCLHTRLHTGTAMPTGSSARASRRMPPCYGSGESRYNDYFFINGLYSITTNML